MKFKRKYNHNPAQSSRASFFRLLPFSVTVAARELSVNEFGVYSAGEERELFTLGTNRKET